MYSHASNYGKFQYFLDPTFFLLTLCPHSDPLIIASACEGTTPKFIFKKELLYLLPVAFVLALLIGHIPINRGNIQKAIASLNEAAKSISKHNTTVAISPEGTRSHTGQLQPFKKGPFYLALNAKVPIIPAIIYNNFQLWPAGQSLPRAGPVYVRFLPPIKINNSSEVENLSQQVHSVMEEAFPSLIQHAKKQGTEFERNMGASLAWLSFVSLVFGVLYYLFWL